MRKFLIILAILPLLSGCYLKQKSKPYTYYELKFMQNTCINKTARTKNIYIANILSTSLVEKRDILVVDYLHKARYLKDAKFITMPSDMVYKAINDAVFSNCGLNPIFAPRENDLRLKVKIITLGVYEDEAVVTLGYEIFNAFNARKSAIITKKVFVKNPQNQTIFNALNDALNLAINEILKAI